MMDVDQPVKMYIQCRWWFPRVMELFSRGATDPRAVPRVSGTCHSMHLASPPIEAPETAGKDSGVVD